MSCILFCVCIFSTIYVQMHSSFGTTAVVGNYLVRQGEFSNGSNYIYSPYMLWNEGINNKSLPLAEPLQLRSVNGRLDVVLRVESVRIHNVFSFNTRVFCYESICSTPGPSIYCKPGDVVEITIVNNLKASTAAEGSSNRTNIYIQGIDLDPRINNPYRFTSGDGDSLTYTHIISKETPPGVHWYHSRVHGNAALHVMGGLFGAFVVEPASTNAQFLPDSLRAMPRQLLVFSHTMLEPPTRSISGMMGGSYSNVDDDYETSSLSLSYLSRRAKSALPLLPTYNQDLEAPVYSTSSAAGNNNIVQHIPVTDAWFTNGLYQPTQNVQAGEWRIFDIVVASGDRIVELELRKYPDSMNSTEQLHADFSDVVFVVGQNTCDMRLLALDGVYLATPRTNLLDPYVQHLTLLQSSTATIAVMCNTTGNFRLQSTTSFNPRSLYYGIGDTLTKSNQVLLTLNVTGPLIDPPLPEPPSDLSSLLEDYLLLRDTLGEEPAEMWTVSTAQDKIDGRKSSDGAGTSIAQSEVQLVPDSGITLCGQSSSQSYRLGLGEDCRLPCYDDTSCSLLYGEFGTNSSYLVASFPTVLNGGCRYVPFRGYVTAAKPFVQLTPAEQALLGRTVCNSPDGTASTGEESEVKEGLVWNNKTYVTEELCLCSSSTATSGDDSPLDTSLVQVHQGSVQQISIWGHKRFPYPLLLQGTQLQVASYQPVELHISNIDAASGSAIYDDGPIVSAAMTPTAVLARYGAGAKGDWRSIVPAITGMTMYRTRIGSRFTGDRLLTTPFLKFEDAGLQTYIEVLPEEGETSTSATPSIAPTTSDGNSDSTTPIDELPRTISSILKQARLGEAPFTAPNSNAFSSLDELWDNLLSAIRAEVSINSTLSPFTQPITVLYRAPQDVRNLPPSAARPFLCSVSGASFRYHEEIDLASRVRIIASSSCPNHYGVCQEAHCGGKQVTQGLVEVKVLVLPLFPRVASPSMVTDVTCTHEPIGVALNGVGLFGLADPIEKREECLSSDDMDWSMPGNFTALMMGRTSCRRKAGKLDGLKYCGDSVRATAKILDKCGGYGDGRLYKYHAAPSCLLNQLSTHAVAEHSPQVGWALDGFPIFGPVGPKGMLMQPCGSAGAHPQLCLDSCNGYRGRLPGYDDYLYRYYMTGEVASGACSTFVENGGACDRVGPVTHQCCASIVPRAVYHPYGVACFRGCVVGDQACAAQGQKGTTSTFLPSPAAYATVVNTESSVGLFLDDNTPVEAPQVITAMPTQMPTSFPTIADPPLPPMSLAAQKISSMVTRDAFTGNTHLASLNALNPSAENGGSAVQDQEIIPAGRTDALFTGMDVDTAYEDIIYFTTQSGIFSYNETSSGLIEVTLFGHNLGNTFADLRQVRIGAESCTSIVHVSSQHVRCLLVLRDFDSSSGEVFQDASTFAAALSADDVYLATISGRTTGIFLQPNTVVRGGSGKPILTSVEFIAQPFRPYALRVLVEPVASTEDAGGEEETRRTVYWTNLAPGAHSVQRCRLDGTQVETVVYNIQRVTSIAILSANLASSNLAFYSHRLSDQVIAAATVNGTGTPKQCSIHLLAEVLAQSAAGAMVVSGDSGGSENGAAYEGSCVDNGHVLLLLDAEQGTLVRVSLPLMSAHYVYASPSSCPILSSSEASSSAVEDTTSSSSYTSSFYIQDDDQMTAGTPRTLSFIQPTTVLRGLTEPSGIALDVSSRNAFINLFHGMVLKLDLDYVLTTYFIDSTSGNEATTSTSDSNTTAAVMHAVHQEVDTVTESGALVNDEAAEGTTSASMGLTGEKHALELLEGYAEVPLLNVTALLRHQRTSAPVTAQSSWSKRHLPSWVKLIVMADGRSRLRGVCAFSANGTAAASATESKKAIDEGSRTWSQQRIIIADTNQQVLHLATDSGGPTQSLDLSAFGTLSVQWPSDVHCKARASRVSASSGMSSQQTVEMFEVFVAEYLGRIWKLTLWRDVSTGSFILRDTKSPLLLVDRSAFPTSIRTRSLLNAARVDGVPSYQKVFFEISN